MKIYIKDLKNQGQAKEQAKEQSKEQSKEADTSFIFNTNFDTLVGTELIKLLKEEKIISAKQGQPVALIVNKKEKDINTQIQDKDEVELLFFSSERGRSIFWHSSAHLLAQAILRLYPNAKPTIGPPIEAGFFYDFADLDISDADFPRIEEEVKLILRSNIKTERIEYENMQEALDAFSSNPFKCEIIKKAEETLSSYKQAEFVDLCTGPHLLHLSSIQAFKLLKTSGSYWRGDVNGARLTRIYGISFPEKFLLKDYLHRIEEARKRDHRILGQRLDLFSFQKEGAGMPFFHPNGLEIWNELLSFLRTLQKKAAYIEIKTPVMLSQFLWERSGHWDNYKENMYTTEEEGATYAIKPMNCPGTMLYYNSKQYSYRQLPLRIAEFGHVHRKELSGALSGLFRVRSFHQDDAHIFLARDAEQLSTEIGNILNLAAKIYSVFNLSYSIELSTRPEKSIGSDEDWEVSTKSLRTALERSGYEFRINEGDGAFYGPKIDFHVKDSLERSWQCGTIQLDMSLPVRFDLQYTAKNGEKEIPYILHRAIFGSIERFIAILIEHFAAKFPLWLAPVQLSIVPVSKEYKDFALDLEKEISEKSIRTNIDFSEETVSKKVRRAQQSFVNYILVVGEKEKTTELFCVRNRENKLIEAVSKKKLLDSLLAEIHSRSLGPLLK